MGVVFVVFFSVLMPFTTHAFFNPEERELAKDFIFSCLDGLEQMQQEKREKIESEIERVDGMIEDILSAPQIDYRKYNVYEYKKELFLKELEKQKSYEESIARPKAKIVNWDELRESEAQALYAYIILSDEWNEYKKNPSNVKVYAHLHRRMLAMARILVSSKGHRVFTAGSHAYPEESDEGVNYDLDRVFLLTLYLLNQDLHAEKAASSTK